MSLESVAFQRKFFLFLFVFFTSTKIKQQPPPLTLKMGLSEERTVEMVNAIF